MEKVVYTEQMKNSRGFTTWTGTLILSFEKDLLMRRFHCRPHAHWAHQWPLTCWLVMVTHWRRSLLIRYSKASSSLTSHLLELHGLFVPLDTGTCCSIGKKESKNAFLTYLAASSNIRYCLYSLHVESVSVIVFAFFLLYKDWPLHLLFVSKKRQLLCRYKMSMLNRIQTGLTSPRISTGSTADPTINQLYTNNLMKV